MVGQGGRKPVSALAVSSLICSLLFCIPFVTSAVGLLLGIVGVAITGPMGRRSGRGIALAGLILGVLGLFGWGYLTVQIYRGIIVPIQQAGEFVIAIRQGDYTRAGRFTVTPFDNARLPELAEKVRELGDFRSFDQPQFRELRESGVSGLAISGVAVFQRGRLQFSAEVVQTPEGWRLRKLDLEPAANPSQPGSDPDASEPNPTRPSDSPPAGTDR